MIESGAIREYIVAGWVLICGIGGYACLGYAVMLSHGEELHRIVNRLLDGGV